MTTTAALRRPARTSVVAAGLVLAVHLVVVFAVRNWGWDDGAITLAFARTLAESGRVALTPDSELVEGSSSVTWMLAMAAFAKLGVTGFDTLIRISQLTAALCAAASAGGLTGLLRRYVPTSAAMAVSVSLFVSAPFLNESMNGMEMTLLAAAAVFAARSVADDARAGLVVAGAVMALTRFEAVGYVVAAAAALLLLGRRPQAVAFAAGGIGAFAATEVARVLIFGAWLPNTVAAKSWAPYSGGGWYAHALTVAQPFVAVWPVVLVAVVVAARRGLPPRLLQDPVVVFASAYAAAVIGFNIVIGANWGHHGRMQMAAMPLLVVAAAAVVAGKVPVRRGALALVAALIVVGSLPVLQWQNLALGVTDGGIGPALTVTPASYQETGEAIDRVRASAGLETLTVLTPDIGGASLSSPRLNILDAALLANPRLARDGYSGFDQYLADTRPEVVQIHDMWAEAAGIYRAPTFLQEYRPVVSGRTWLWVRADVAERLPVRPVPGEDESALRYRGDPEDEAFIAAVDHRAIYLG